MWLGADISDYIMHGAAAARVIVTSSLLYSHLIYLIMCPQLFSDTFSDASYAMNTFGE